MKMEKRIYLWFAVILTVLAGFTAPVFAGSLEPGAPPGPTMKTLDEIPPTWSQKLTAAQRFQLVLDGAAVLDKETGLVWEKSPDTTYNTWNFALHSCYQKVVGGRQGWRLPTVEELTSLLDTSVSVSPKLPSGHPFNNQYGVYWTATTDANNIAAWYVNTGGSDGSGFFPGAMGTFEKDGNLEWWCVRGGQGYGGW